MKKLLVPGLILVGLLNIGLVLAGGTGINKIPVLITNTTGAIASAVQLPFNLSSQSLVSGSWMSATALDTDVQDSNTPIAYMPGTGQVRVLACFNNAGTDQTTACNNATTGDITLPVTGSQVWEVAADNQFAHLWLNISTAAVANWDITWEYYNGASYVALTGVVDGTNELQTSGTNRVTWSFPSAGLWTSSALHGITGYWVRARISSFTSITASPVGAQTWYETGRWWVHEDTIGIDEQKRYDVQVNIPVTGTDVTTVFSASDSRHVVGGGMGYPPAFSNVQVAGPIEKTNFGAGSFILTERLLQFNTASLPDYVSIDTATLTCSPLSKTDTDARSLVAEWYNWSSAAQRNYVTTPATGALTGVALSAITTGVANTWTLTNLHRINKAGLTGLRLNLSGTDAGLTGENILNAGTCSLSVTYNDLKPYHWYLPHADGVTLTDTALLEAGASYRLILAGYFDTSSTGGVLMSKGAAVSVTSQNGALRILINGVNKGDPILANGYHVFEFRQIGTAAGNEFEAIVDGTLSIGSATITPADNATDWTLMRGQVMRALEYIEWQVSTSDRYIHQIRGLPNHQLDNQFAPNAGLFTAIARYPDTISGYTTTLLSLEPTGVTDTTENNPFGDFVAPQSSLTNLTPGEHNNPPGSRWLGLWAIFQIGSSPTGVPYQAWLVMFAFILTCGAGMLSWVAFKSVHITYIALLIASVSFVYMGSGLWGWMIPITFAVTGAIYIVWRRAAV